MSEKYRVEEIPVGNRKVRATQLRGQHDSDCEKTIDGWICHPACTIEVMPILTNLRHVVDELSDVKREFWRVGWWKGARWSLTRISTRRVFIDGFCRYQDLDIVYEKWFEGSCWTRWGARRKAKRYYDTFGAPDHVLRGLES